MGNISQPSEKGGQRLTGMVWLVGSAVALIALRWVRFRPRWAETYPWWATTAAVMFLWVAAASIPLPVPLTSAKGAESCKACPGKHLDPITDIASLNRWFSEVQALINAQLQWAPH